MEDGEEKIVTDNTLRLYFTLPDRAGGKCRWEVRTENGRPLWSWLGFTVDAAIAAWINSVPFGVQLSEIVMSCAGNHEKLVKVQGLLWLMPRAAS